MSTNQYYRLALLHYIKMNHNLQQIHQELQQIDAIKEKITARHKKHRRSDKEIEKCLNCSHCQRIYATQVALKLHVKLKHRETLMDKNSDSHTVVVSQSDKENIDVNIGTD